MLPMILHCGLAGHLAAPLPAIPSRTTGLQKVVVGNPVAGSCPNCFLRTSPMWVSPKSSSLRLPCSAAQRELSAGSVDVAPQFPAHGGVDPQLLTL